MPVVHNLPHWAIIALPAAVLWELLWKGLALWRAARRSQAIWFVCILIINTVGILPIVYLLLTGRATKKDGTTSDER